MDYWEYLQKINKWKSNDMDIIWWDAFEAAITSVGSNIRQVVQKFIHNKLISNKRKNKYYQYKTPICYTCNQEVETQHHIMTCKGCPTQVKLREKYLLDLGILLINNHTNNSCSTLITQNVSNYLNNRDTIRALQIAPDATTTLTTACTDQQRIGWKQWLNGRLSSNWGTLQNYDIKTMAFGIKFNTAKKWAKSIILLSWSFAYDTWLARNAIEHDHKGNPELRKRQKLIEDICGKSQLTKYKVCKETEIIETILKKLPKDNLLMLEQNIRNERNREKQRKENTTDSSAQCDGHLNGGQGKFAVLHPQMWSGGS
jgi:hypothetical protein